MSYRLFIDDTLVLDSDDPSAVSARLELDSMERRYGEPATLVFRTLGDWRGRLYQPDSVARLERDGTVIFVGRLDLPRHTAAAGGVPTVEYSAVDAARILRTRDAINDDGHTSFDLEPNLLENVVSEYLVGVADVLEDVGVSATVLYGSGAATLPCLPVRIENANVWDGLLRIAGAANGVAVLIDPNDGEPAVRFVRLFGSTRLTVNLDQYRTEDVQIRQTLEGRCGAVSTQSRQVSAAGAAEVTSALAAAWDAGETSSWTLDKALSTDASGAESAVSMVFRKYSFAQVANTIPSGAELRCEVGLESYIPTLWRPVEIAEINWEASTLTLKFPAVTAVKNRKATRRNPNVPGQATVAPVRMSYRVGGRGRLTVPGERYPAVGFTGRAVAMAPVTCGLERKVEVPSFGSGSFDHAAFARAAHAVYSEPLTEGSITLVGPPPDDALLLDRRICLSTSSHGTTGFESLDAPLKGVRLQFVGGGRTVLELSDDRSQTLGEYGGSA